VAILHANCFQSVRVLQQPALEYQSAKSMYHHRNDNNRIQHHPPPVASHKISPNTSEDSGIQRNNDGD
jgi:hypothetical protein